MTNRFDPIDAEGVAAALSGAGLRPRGAGPLVLERAWPDRRRGLVALFAGTGPETPDERWSLVPLPEGRLRGAERRALRAGRAVMLPGLGAFAQRFPDDVALPRLREALEPSAARDRLREAIDERFGIAGEVTTRVLGYRPLKRSVIEYEVGTPGGGRRSFIAKCYREGRDDATWLSHGLLLGASRRGRAAAPVVAHPLGRVLEWRMLLWRRRPGRPFIGMLNEPGGAVSARSIGRALAGLHGSGAPWTKEHPIASELLSTGRWVEAASGAHPFLRRLLAAAAHALGLYANRITTGPLRPAHLDFYDKQILIRGDRITLLDLDTAGLAEPELDLGNFVAHLRLRALQGLARGWEIPAAAFIDGYASAASRHAPAGSAICRPVADRLRFYRASAQLRLACVYAFRPCWRGLPDVLAEDVLTITCPPSRGRKRIDARPMDAVRTAGRPRVHLP